LKQDDFFSSPIIQQPYQQADSTSILMNQDVFHPAQDAHANSPMSQFHEQVVDSAPTYWFDDWWYQQQFSSTMSNQILFDDIMNSYA
jgi:hypothetical protein